jgi:hypothetical protein
MVGGQQGNSMVEALLGILLTQQVGNSTKIVTHTSTEANGAAVAVN